MRLIARAKTARVEQAQLYGEAFGVMAYIELLPRQKWNAKKSDGYWWLTRKGHKLRLTEAALCRLFTLEQPPKEDE